MCATTRVALTIAERGVDAERVVDALAAALECGDAPMRCPTQALVVTADGEPTIGAAAQP